MAKLTVIPGKVTCEITIDGQPRSKTIEGVYSRAEVWKAKEDLIAWVYSPENKRSER